MTMTIQSIQNQGTIQGTNSSQDLPAGGTITGGLDSSDALLPSPALISGGADDIGAAIAMLGVRTGNDENKIETSAEETQNKLQDDAEESAVSEMRQEASDIMSNAMAAGCMQICQGMAQIGSAGVPQSEQGTFTGTASIYGAGATFFTAQGQAQTQLDQALVTSYNAIAARAGQGATEANQGQQSAQSLVSNAIQFYQQYEQSKAQLDLVAAGQKA
jgi:hypothetical protein